MQGSGCGESSKVIGVERDDLVTLGGESDEGGVHDIGHSGRSQ